MSTAAAASPPLPFKKLLETGGQLFRRLTTIKMPEAKLTVGLDIGSTAVKVVALGARKGGGQRPLLGQSLVVLEPGQETDASAAIKAAIAKLHFPVRAVNLSVSGPWVIMRIIEMPVMKPNEIRQALPFEAQRYLPFSIQDVVVDGLVLGSIDANKMWVLIVACKKELIDRRIDWIRRAGLEAALIDVDALALANSFLGRVNGQRAGGTRAIMNVGAQLTSLVIMQGETPYLVRDIPWGGEKLIRHVAEQTGLESEAVQKELAQAETASGLQSALRIASESLVTELQLSFDYFENRFGQPPDEILVSGGLGQSAMFRDALKSHLSQTLTPWVPLNDLSGQFSVAYGLALRTS
jgi:type IV pilus assembly protein PilM